MPTSKLTSKAGAMSKLEEELGADKTHIGSTEERIALIPRPSDDPKDPLNWPSWKKHSIFFTLCLSGFAGLASVNVHQLAYIDQASYYHKDPVTLSYSVSAGLAGVVAGPLLLVPLASIIGRASLVFWCLIFSLACNIWGPLMTGPDDYIPFVLSRLFAGLFGSVPIILASSIVMDLYFLHQRGKAFTALEVSLLSGFIATPVFGGFIANSKPWPDVFWWLVAVIAVSIVVSFFVLEETYYDRHDPLAESSTTASPAQSFFANRVATFFPGTSVVKNNRKMSLGKRYIGPILVGLSPVTVLAGLFVMAILGFTIALGIVSSIFLQNPPAEGGYGFTPLQNAAFNTSWWFGLILCQLCGGYLNDTIPLRLARRSGTWHAEYRLAPIFLVVAASPIGLGLFGAGLQYHLHYMVLALGTFFVMFGGCYSTPITVNYITECFPEMSLEVAVIMNIWRQGLGLSIPFFIFSWEAATGPGWLFGTMAFICVFVSLLMVLVVWKGASLRKYNLVSTETEDGVAIVESKDD